MRPTAACLLLPLLLAPAAPAVAGGVAATYEIHLAGATILHIEARYEVDNAGYRMEARLRTTGVAASLAPGQQMTRVTGAWAGAAPAPRDFVSEGTWRSIARRIAMTWSDGEPRVTDLTPPETEEREPVPPALRRGTVDGFSAVVALLRTVERTGTCDGTAAVFDGRRRTEQVARTERREVIRPWRGTWAGEALRCGFEGRMVAGFRRDGDRAEASRPQTGTAWIASPFAGAPPIPVRIEIPTRLFGTATAVLVRAEPAGAQAAQQGR